MCLGYCVGTLLERSMWLNYCKLQQESSFQLVCKSEVLERRWLHFRCRLAACLILFGDSFMH